jgi:hypothetical protein
MFENWYLTKKKKRRRRIEGVRVRKRRITGTGHVELEECFPSTDVEDLQVRLLRRRAYDEEVVIQRVEAAAHARRFFLLMPSAIT